MLICPTEMEVSGSEWRTEMHCAIKFCYCLKKLAPDTDKLLKEAYKDKFFGEPMIFWCYGDFKRLLTGE